MYIVILILGSLEMDLEELRVFLISFFIVVYSDFFGWKIINNLK